MNLRNLAAKRRPKVLFASVMAILAGVATIGISAEPASAAAVCNSGRICLYQEASDTGSMTDPSQLTGSPYAIGDFRFFAFHDGEWLDNNVGSVDNKSTRCLNIFPGYNYDSAVGNAKNGVVSHQLIVVGPGGKYSNLEPFGRKLSSAYTYKTIGGKCDHGVPIGGAQWISA